jgi:hypothetical protein
MGLVEHAEREMKAIGLDTKEADYEGMLYHAVLELITTFAKQGHSGASAERTLFFFERLARFDTFLPITSNKEEWNLVEEPYCEKGETLYQNNRNSRYFTNDFKTYYNVYEKANWFSRKFLGKRFKEYKFK